jgi:CspA family cold shock protein
VSITERLRMDQLPIVIQSGLLGGMLAGVIGGLTGLVLGLNAYVRTAWFAVLEVGLPSAIIGATLGTGVGLIRLAMRHRRRSMSVRGVIRLWHEDDGWGVVDAPQTPGGCWASFSTLAAAAFWEPQEGEPVEFEFEVFPQDAFAYRAMRMWPFGTAPVDRTPEAPGSAFGSAFTVEFD